MSMGLATITATATSLAMDTLSVSICIGMAKPNMKIRNGVIFGGVFSLFQFTMPLVGGVFASQLSGFLSEWTPRISSALIIFIALRMIYESRKHGVSCPSLNVSIRNLALLGLATSLDALAVGFSIKNASGSVLALAILSGVITFVTSLLGSIGGAALGDKIGTRAQHLGAAILMIIAANIIFG